MRVQFYQLILMNHLSNVRATLYNKQIIPIDHCPMICSISIAAINLKVYMLIQIVVFSNDANEIK